VPKPTAAALIPLSLLEALRNLDTPVEDGMDELAEEIAVRRLGLSPTVAAQIQRYRQTRSVEERWIQMKCSRYCGWSAGALMRPWSSPTPAGAPLDTPQKVGAARREL